MLIITPYKTTFTLEKPKKVVAKKLKTKCCKKYKKDDRCTRCPCFDLIQKAS